MVPAVQLLTDAETAFARGHYARAWNLATMGLDRSPGQDRRALVDVQARAADALARSPGALARSPGAPARTKRAEPIPPRTAAVPPGGATHPPGVAAASAAVADGRVEEALALLDRAVAIEPASAAAHALRGMVLLVVGRFEEGFAEYEWRHRVPGFEGDRPNLPSWTGAPLLPGQTLLLWDEQGFGDTIQFARFAAHAARRSQARVVLRVHPCIQRLLASCPGVDAVEAREGRPPVAAAQRSLLSVPAALGLGAGDLPANGPWLTAEPTRVEEWRRRLDRLAPRPRPRIGVAWQGNPSHPQDGRRSVPLRVLAPLVRDWAGRASFISLQKGPSRDDIAAAACPMIDFGADLDAGRDAFVDTAAVIANLDLVVTSDTSIAHLAAALGAPVCVMLARPCDWRWGRDGERSIFYPTAELVRQRVPGEWSGVVDRLGAALAARFVAGSRT